MSNALALILIILQVVALIKFVRRETAELSVWSQKARLEEESYLCAQVQAMVNNILYAASHLESVFQDRSPQILRRRDELIDQISSRLLSCGPATDWYESYIQQNRNIPKDWPNWWVRPRID